MGGLSFGRAPTSAGNEVADHTVWPPSSPLSRGVVSVRADSMLPRRSLAVNDRGFTLDPGLGHSPSSTIKTGAWVGVVVSLPDHSQRPMPERDHIA